MSTVIRMPNYGSGDHKRKSDSGCRIGCFRVCTCMNPGFIMSKSGMLKIFEILLGCCLETLLINFGSKELSLSAYQSLLTTVLASLTTTTILCLCYVLSSKSFILIRQSMFELLFNGLAFFSYMSASCFMGFMSKLPTYRNILLFTLDNTNPTLSCIYYISTVLAVIYLADTIVAFKNFREL